jgi:2,3-dihydroxybenzoate decarboxylase
MVTETGNSPQTGAEDIATASRSAPRASRGAARIIAVEEAWACAEWFDAMTQLPLMPSETVERRFMNAVVSNPAYRRALADIPFRLDHMDAAGLDMQILSIIAPGVQILTSEHATRVAAVINDRLATVVHAHPDRFAGLGTVAPQDPAAAATEVRRVMRDLKLNGILINSHTNGEYLDNPRYWPILEAASDTGAPIYIHPRTPLPQIAAPFDEYGLTGAVYGFPADTGLHALRLVMSGVFDRFPDLKIVLGHLGEALPFWLWRIDNLVGMMRASGVAQKLSMPDLKRKPSEYLCSNFVVTTSGMAWQPVFEFCRSALGIDNIIFAVDYPFEDSAAFVDFLRELNLSEEDKAKLASGNAKRVFGIS